MSRIFPDIISEDEVIFNWDRPMISVKEGAHRYKNGDDGVKMEREDH